MDAKINILFSLTPIEKSVVFILYDYKFAIPTRKIIDAFPLNIRNNAEGEPTSNEASSTRYINLNDLLLPYYENENIPKKIYKTKLGEMISKIKYPTTQKEIDKLKILLSKEGISTPSFKSVEKACITLHKLKIVIKRESEDEKTKVLWALSPSYREAMVIHPSQLN